MDDKDVLVAAALAWEAALRVEIEVWESDGDDWAKRMDLAAGARGDAEDALRKAIVRLESNRG